MPARIFAGPRLKALRSRLGLSQGAMAARLGISVSYLSQIEAGDRPLTRAVLAAVAQSFPSDWGDVASDDTDALFIALLEAATDTGVASEPLDADAVRRAVRHHPQLARRMAAIHTAYRGALEQLQTLDDRVERGEAQPLPWEDVRQWFQAADNYVDALDRAAEAIADTLPADDPPLAILRHRLAEAHGVQLVSQRDAEQAPLRAFDPETRTLAVDATLPQEAQAFQLAHQLMRLEAADIIADVVRSAELESEAARRLLSVGLANYAAGALLMPYLQFRDAAFALRHDVDRLRGRFGVSFEQACHRLSTLQRPGVRGVPVFFYRIDMAGNITKRHSATRLQFAQYGGACPLWIAHDAVALPDRTLVQLAETPDGHRYLTIARGHVKAAGSFARMPRRYAVALGCGVEDAGRFVYGDGLDLAGASSATPIGVSCRICPRQGCDQRAFPPTGREIIVDPDHRSVIPYRFA